MPQLDPNKYLGMNQPKLDPNKYRSMPEPQQPTVDTPQVNRPPIARPDTRIFNASEVFDKLREYSTDRIATGRLPEYLKKPAAIAASLLLEPPRLLAETIAEPEAVAGGIAKGLFRGFGKQAPKEAIKPTQSPYVKITPKPENERGFRTPERLKSTPEAFNVPVPTPPITVDSPIATTKNTVSPTLKRPTSTTKNRSIPERIRLRELTKKSETATLTPEELTEARKLQNTITEANFTDEERLLLQDTPSGRIQPQLATVDTPTPDVTLPTTIKPKEHGVADYLNIPKAFSASGDVSNPFRQSITMIGRKEWWQSWKPMMKSLFSEDAYKVAQKEITSSPKFQEALGNGVSLTDFPGPSLPTGLGKDVLKKLSQQEEQFASRVAEKITGGKYSPIRASNRAYTAFANNLRMKVYESLSNNIDELVAKGNILDSKLIKKNTANYINSATGRGSMGLRIGEKSDTLERGAELLNTVFWSPRFLASRAQLINPLSYTKLDPFTRKEALKDIVKAATAGMSILEVAKLAGAEVDLNPTSSDFLKAKFGNTRVDMSGGFSPVIRFVAQSIDGIANISDKDAKGPDALRFVRSKLSPSASFFVDQLSGKNYLGKSVETIGERGENLGSKFTPMVAQDFWELYQENPELFGLGVVSLIGGSVQSYDSKKKGSSGIPKVELPSFPTRPKLRN